MFWIIMLGSLVACLPHWPNFRRMAYKFGLIAIILGGIGLYQTFAGAMAEFPLRGYESAAAILCTALFIAAGLFGLSFLFFKAFPEEEPES